MLLLFDIGNTNTHAGLANDRRVVKQTNIPTANWFNGAAAKLVRKFVGRARLEGVALCSVVPRATPFVHQTARTLWKLGVFELTPKTCGAWELIIRNQIQSVRIVWQMRLPRDITLARRW